MHISGRGINPARPTISPNGVLTFTPVQPSGGAAALLADAVHHGHRSALPGPAGRVFRARPQVGEDRDDPGPAAGVAPVCGLRTTMRGSAAARSTSAHHKLNTSDPARGPPSWARAMTRTALPWRERGAGRETGASEIASRRVRSPGRSA